MTNEERKALIAQGWTPPVAVDPDWAEAVKLANEYAECDDWPFLANWFLKAIKRGRALAAAEAKPGMVWVKHDGSRQSPVPGALVTVSLGHSHYQTDVSFMIDWWMVSYYAIITQPEEK